MGKRRDAACRSIFLATNYNEKRIVSSSRLRCWHSCKKVPLTCDAETFVRYHWLYFYERSIGCIGVLKDWLLRAVSTALDEGQDTLTLDWVQDQAPLVDQCRQMALDATEGEQKLNHTESNREHLWRLLQGGELVAPIPPLPPRATVPLPLSFLVPNQA